MNEKVVQLIEEQPFLEPYKESLNRIFNSIEEVKEKYNIVDGTSLMKHYDKIYPLIEELFEICGMAEINRRIENLCDVKGIK